MKMKYIQTSLLNFLNESKKQNFNALYKIAKGVDYDTFLNKTDELTNQYNILYRGQSDEYLTDNSFMTDYIRHAIEYGEVVVGIIYNEPVMHFDNNTFNKLRHDDFAKLLIPHIHIDFEYDVYEKKFKEKLKQIYKPYFDDGKLLDAIYQLNYTETMIIDFVYDFLVNSAVDYKKYSMNKQNDFLVPLLMYYAKSKGINIISFWGVDYGDYGGAMEFVVSDVSKYTTLKSIWNDVNKTKKHTIVNESSENILIEEIKKSLIMETLIDEEEFNELYNGD